MRETAFVQLNKNRWEEFEQSLQRPRAIHPDRMIELYVQLSDDLAYAQTQYPQGEVTAYLHNLLGRVHKLVYQNKRQPRRRIITFWTEELPLLLYQHRRDLLYSLLVFALAVMIGAFSAAHDSTFVRLIMGDSYVEMTEGFIEEDDPMAVYKQQGRSSMFLAITFNNIKVSLLVFAAGIFTAVGSGLLLLKNGIMLGAFQYFFYQKGLLLPSVLTVWIHGTLEISAIIVAGAAGFIMGNSFLFPGSYPRGYSFRRGARRGIKILIGLVPLFIIAGFLEGFVTRLTHWPVAAKLAVIGSSLLFVIFYFIWYPRLKAHHEKHLSQDQTL